MIKENLLKYGRIIKDYYIHLKSFYYEYLLKEPQKHAQKEVLRQKQILLRPVNVIHPLYFSEKMLWLKYNLYNNSPLIAQCYNKFEVRRYIESKGLKHILNELYCVWNSIDEINWDIVPEECVIKISNGYSGHVFKFKENVFDKSKAIQILKRSLHKSSFMWRISGDVFVSKTKQYIICERRLRSNLGFEAPEDYKFYCFNGVPKFVTFMSNRHNGSNYDEYFVDINLNDRHDLEGEAIPGTFTKPLCYDEMIEIAKILSADFPFVRVDLYVDNGRPIFGELTFTPFHVQTRQSEDELGNLLNISNLNDYEVKLSKRV